MDEPFILMLFGDSAFGELIPPSPLVKREPLAALTIEHIHLVAADQLFGEKSRHFGAKFMVVAPSSTVDMAMPHGRDIHIDLREPKELLEHAGHRVAAEGVDAWNPVFDVAPAELIDAIVTERGVIEKPDAGKMSKVFGSILKHGISDPVPC